MSLPSLQLSFGIYIVLHSVFVKDLTLLLSQRCSFPLLIVPQSTVLSPIHTAPLLSPRFHEKPLCTIAYQCILQSEFSTSLVMIPQYYSLIVIFQLL